MGRRGKGYNPKGAAGPASTNQQIGGGGETKESPYKYNRANTTALSRTKQQTTLIQGASSSLLVQHQGTRTPPRADMTRRPDAMHEGIRRLYVRDLNVLLKIDRSCKQMINHARVSEQQHPAPDPTRGKREESSNRHTPDPRNGRTAHRVDPALRVQLEAVAGRLLQLSWSSSVRQVICNRAGKNERKRPR